MKDLSRVLGEDIFFTGGMDKKDRKELGNKVWGKVAEIKSDIDKEKAKVLIEK
jgi:hypothetical protein